VSNPLESRTAPNPPGWSRETAARHLAVCWRWQLETGNGCVCRPPACVEPLKPTPDELRLAFERWL
jgi:hypothetical protein